MPRDSAGVMSLPPSTWATSGQTIAVNQHNPPMREIEQALTDSLPRNGSAGMTGNLPMAGNRITNLGAPVLDSDAVSLGFASALSPVGVIVDFAGDNAPVGWLLCFGQEVNRSTEAALFAVLGIKFGAGNGSTTFNLPDLRGRIGVGKDNMGGTGAERVTAAGSGIDGNTVGAAGGVQAVVLTLDQIPAHAHGGETSEAPAHTHDITANTRYGADPSGGVGGWDVGDRTTGTQSKTSTPSGAHKHIIPSQGGGLAHNNMQPSIVINKIIRVR